MAIQEYLAVVRPTKSITESVKKLIALLEHTNHKLNLRIIWPIHPRTNNNLEKFKISLPNFILKMPPVGYIDMLNLMQNANLILTDSGGIQEEACIMHVPCITIRDNTERPETVTAGANLVVGTTPHKVLTGAKNMLEKPRIWSNPFGDGSTSIKIVEILTSTKQ